MLASDKQNLLRDAWVEIDLSSLKHNIEKIRSLVINKNIIAVLKADAYGHGMLAAAYLLMDCGLHSVGVATVDEAIELRQGGYEGQIIVLGLAPGTSYELMIKNQITPVFCDEKQIMDFDKLSSKIQNPTLPEFIYLLDSGMGRIGVTIYNKESAIKVASDFNRIKNSLSSIKCIGVISHFASSDDSDEAYTNTQLDRFKEFLSVASFEEEALISIANSAAILKYPNSHFNTVRAGIILFGLFPFDNEYLAELTLEPVMSVHARITHVKDVPSGTAISYGSTFRTNRDSRIATIPIGYADGYLREFSSNADVLINGKRAPIVGRICMDQFMIDVTEIPEAITGTEVIVMGSSCEDRITADELARLAHTINYEICCLFGLRLDKIYTNVPGCIRRYFHE